MGINFNEIRLWFLGGRDVLEVLVQVDESKMSEELRRGYKIYEVKFEDMPGCEGYGDVRRRIEDAKKSGHIEGAKRGL